MTKVQETMKLLRRLEELKSEMASTHDRLRDLHQQMGHPPKEQIERAAEMGKEIRRGCTEDP
jgi:hypothetical protein